MTATPYRELGRVLREARKTRNMTLHAVGSALDVSEGFVSAVEGGRKRPGQDLAVAWAQLLGLSPPRVLNLAGHLSAEGVAEVARRMPFDDYIRSDPNLTAEQRNALTTVYRSYVTGARRRSSSSA